MMEFTDHFFYLHNVRNVSVVNYTINNKDCVKFVDNISVVILHNLWSQGFSSYLLIGLGIKDTLLLRSSKVFLKEFLWAILLDIFWPTSYTLS